MNKKHAEIYKKTALINDLEKLDEKIDGVVNHVLLTLAFQKDPVETQNFQFKGGRAMKTDDGITYYSEDVGFLASDVKAIESKSDEFMLRQKIRKVILEQYPELDIKS